MEKLVDIKEFKRGMLGLLKVLAQESLKHQRLDHYSLYATMQTIVVKHADPDMELLEDEEAIARMILNFPNDDS